MDDLREKLFTQVWSPGMSVEDVYDQIDGIVDENSGMEVMLHQLAERGLPAKPQTQERIKMAEKLDVIIEYKPKTPDEKPFKIGIDDKRVAEFTPAKDTQKGPWRTEMPKRMADNLATRYPGAYKIIEDNSAKPEPSSEVMALEEELAKSRTETEMATAEWEKADKDHAKCKDALGKLTTAVASAQEENAELKKTITALEKNVAQQSKENEKLNDTITKLKEKAAK